MLSRFIHGQLAGLVVRRQANLLMRAPPETQARFLGSLTTARGPCPIALPCHARNFSLTAILRKDKKVEGQKSVDAVKEAANALDRAGQNLERTGRDLELAGKALGSEGTALVSSGSPPPLPQPPEPPQVPGGFSASPFTTGSSILDAVITTVIGLSMGECGVLWWYLCV